MAQVNTSLLRAQLRRRRLLISLVLLLIVAGYVFFSNRGIISRFSLQWEKAQLQEDISNYKQKIDSLQNYIQRLHSDTLLIERLAREQHGMIKPGETIFFIESSKADKEPN